MARHALRAAAACALALAAAIASAQGTAGMLAGRITDERGLSVANVDITASSAAIGLQRSTTTDDAGMYEIPGLPIGEYEVEAALSGGPQKARAVLTVGTATVVDFTMKTAADTAGIVVTTSAPLIDVRASGVGEVVRQVQVDGLPINDRQFANLAALVPGVGLGFFPNQLRNTLLVPEVAGGGGVNVAYRIDGADGNDDRSGGLAQLYPLDAIEEFNFENARFKPEFGRSMGGVLNVVTRSGTNDFTGTAFGLFRSEALTADTVRQRGGGGERPSEPFTRWQYGASAGGPIVRDRTHFFAAFERTQQDADLTVESPVAGVQGGTHELPLRINLFFAKLSQRVSAGSQMSLRYAYHGDSVAFAVRSDSPPESWADQRNRLHALSSSLSSLLGGGAVLNELTAQVNTRAFERDDRSSAPSELFPGGARLGAAGERSDIDDSKLQIRDDLTWTPGAHEVKTGFSYLRNRTDETVQGFSPVWVHAAPDVASPIRQVRVSARPPGHEGSSLTIQQVGFYLQDTWRASRRLTVDFGVRYDLATGFDLDQSANPLFVQLQALGRSQDVVGVARGPIAGAPGFEGFGLEGREDRDNLAPRAGLAFDWNGDGTLVLRAGAGRYYDLLNAGNGPLRVARAAQSPNLNYTSPSDPRGLRNPDGTLLAVGQLPAGYEPSLQYFEVAAPRLLQPYTDQANVGVSHRLGDHTVVELDAVYVRGADLPMRPPLNPELPSGERRFASLIAGEQGTLPWRVVSSNGRSHYKAATLAVKHAWSGRAQLLASYTLATATATSVSTDTIGHDTVDAFAPFSAVHEGPTETDARHRITASGIWSPGWGLSLASVFRYRSATPYTVVVGRDLNSDGDRGNDLPQGSATVRQARGASLSQLDVRLSRDFGPAKARLTLMVEAFNVLDARNPWAFEGNQSSPGFGQPTRFAGEAPPAQEVSEQRQSDQRQARIGLRVRF